MAEPYDPVAANQQARSTGAPTDPTTGNAYDGEDRVSWDGFGTLLGIGATMAVGGPLAAGARGAFAAGSAARAAGAASSAASASRPVGGAVTQAARAASGSKIMRWAGRGGMLAARMGAIGGFGGGGDTLTVAEQHQALSPSQFPGSSPMYY